ncbi:MAG: hypothetical protein GY884_11180 [Proteobacteria bacterium]|nr:hypothetical protein [Pseudomonadota bacterium]
MADDKYLAFRDTGEDFEFVEGQHVFVEKRIAVRGLRRAAKKLGKGATFAAWTGDSEKGYRLLSSPTRQPERIWRYEEPTEQTARYCSEVAPGWTLEIDCTAKGADDVYAVRVVTAQGPRLLTRQDAAWVSADGLIRLGERARPSLGLEGVATARRVGAGVTLQLSRLSARGGLGLPPDLTFVVLLGDGTADTEVGVLVDDDAIAIDEHVQDMADPRVQVICRQLEDEDGRALATSPVRVDVRVTFSGIRLHAQDRVRVGDTMDRVFLMGASLAPPHLPLSIGQSLGGEPRIWQERRATRGAQDANGCWYELAPGWTLPDDSPGIGEVRLRHADQLLGAVEIEPAPLATCWSFPDEHDGPRPRTLDASNLVPATHTGAPFSLLPNGQVRYDTPRKQLGELADHAFEPLLFTPGDLQAFEDLVRRNGPLFAWQPGDEERTWLDAHSPDIDELLRAHAEASLAGSRLRLGHPHGRLRGVLDRRIFEPVPGDEIMPVGGVFHLPAERRKGTLWHRGLRLEFDLVPLDEQATQVAVRLREPIVIDAAVDCDLGPFRPARGWFDEHGVRLQDAEERLQLHPMPGSGTPFMDSGQTLHLHWPGFGYFSAADEGEPEAGDGRFSWNGLLLQGRGRDLAFEGWLATERPTFRPAFGRRFERWGLVLGTPGGTTSGERLVRAGDLDDLPEGVRAACERFLGGSKGHNATVPGPGGAWTIVPVKSRPGVAPDACRVVPPAVTTQASRSNPSVRIWLT